MRQSEKEWIVMEVRESNKEVGRQLREVKLAVAEVRGLVAGLQQLVRDSKEHPFDRYTTEQLIAMMQQGVIAKQELTDYVKGAVSK